MLEQTLRSLVDSGASVKVTLETLGDQFGTLLRLTVDGGPAAVRSADQLARGLTKLPCPVNALGLSTQAGCSPTDIANVVSTISKNAIEDGIQPKSLSDALTKVCCEPIDGGDGYISGAENLVLKAQEQSKNARNLTGIITEANVGNSLRNSGYTDLEFPTRNSYTAPNGSSTEPDIIGIDKQGQKRVLDAKTGSLFSVAQLDRLAFVAKQIPGNPRPSIVSPKCFFPDVIQDAVDRGIDVLDVSGNVIAKGK